MKINAWIRYFIYFVLISVIVFVGEKIFIYMKGNTDFILVNSIVLQNILRVLLFGSIGAVLGVEHLINESRKRGPWRINIPHLIFLVLPSLYFSLAYIIYYSDFVPVILTRPISFLMLSGVGYIVIFQVIFGYLAVTSFYKPQRD